MGKEVGGVGWGVTNLDERSVSTGVARRVKLGTLGQVEDDLVTVHGQLRLARLGQGNDDDAGVVGTQHALAPA